MNLLLTFLVCISFSMYGCGKQTAIVRPATSTDLNQLNELSNKQYENDFKPMWQASYAPLFPSLNTEKFVAEKAHLNNLANKNFIEQQELGKTGRLLVVEIEDDAMPFAEIAGFCRFEQRNEKTIYINFILVDENSRKKGLAKQLIFAAMKTFPNTTTCQFRALFHNTQVNNIYTQHGCKQVGTVALDINTGKISTDPDAPITHVDYEYTIQQ